MVAVLQTLKNFSVRATDVKKWTAEDPLLSRVMDLVLHGLGSRHTLFHHMVSMGTSSQCKTDVCSVGIELSFHLLVELQSLSYSMRVTLEPLAQRIWHAHLYGGLESRKMSRRWSNDAMSANRQDTTHLQHLYIHGSFQTTLGNVYIQILPARCMEGRCS